MLHELDNYNFDNWLDSLKDRIQPNQVWSEEDEYRMNNLCYFLEEYGNQYYGYLTLLCTISWLKFFKDRYIWKPSNAQMASITCAVRKMKESACYDSELVSLLNDLKKL